MGENMSGSKQSTDILRAGEIHRISLQVNEQHHSTHAHTRTLLVDLLRHDLGLTGTHVGCEHGVCGSCTVQVNGSAQRSCLILAVQVDGAQLQTVEGLTQTEGVLSVLQEAFKRHHALQCGFCTPGILMSCVDWLERLKQIGKKPSEQEVREMLSGHLCRCTGYTPIVQAVMEVAHA
jgi:2-furoyl-CoA dehydrogenase 2Fe-2S iron sulfur subunit